MITVKIGPDDVALVVSPKWRYELAHRDFDKQENLPLHVCLMHAIAMRLSDDLRFRNEQLDWLQTMNKLSSTGDLKPAARA